MVRIAAGQLCSTSNIAQNLEHCIRIISGAASAGARVCCLPEAADFISKDAAESHRLAASQECADFVVGVRQAARDHKCHVNVGVHEAGKDRLANVSLWIDDTGAITQRYQKLHLFDADLKNGITIKESASTEPGNEIVPPFDTPCGKVGMAICFDLRFPELSTRLRRLGANVLLYPSAFAVRTGQAHWETLLRARAIETSSWVIASAQAGQHNDKRASWGHTLVVDPWGSIVAQVPDVLTDQPTFVLADIDHDITSEVRTGLPLHRRTDVYPEI